MNAGSRNNYNNNWPIDDPAERKRVMDIPIGLMGTLGIIVCLLWLWLVISLIKKAG